MEMFYLPSLPTRLNKLLILPITSYIDSSLKFCTVKELIAYLHLINLTY